MKPFRKKRRPGNCKPNAEESKRIEDAKAGPCMACMVWFVGKNNDLVIFGGDYNHVKSGNIRIGHMAGYCLCLWHHKRQPQPNTPQEHMDFRMLTRTYGPSLMDGSNLFQETYGTHQQLIDMQTEWLT